MARIAPGHDVGFCNMHDIKWIRDNADAFDRGLTRRGLPAEAGRLIAIDERRRAAIVKAEAAQARRNAASKEIGAAKKSNEEETAQRLMAEVAELKAAIPALEAEEKEALAGARQCARADPQPAARRGAGRQGRASAMSSTIISAPSAITASTPKQHFDLGEALGLMDFETAAKLSGARFVVLKSGLARLERALGQFMLDLHTGEHGYTEVNPPLLVRDDAMFGTAQLPKFEEDQFAAASTEMFQDALHQALGKSGQRSARGGGQQRALADPHRRGAADQSGARVDRRGGRRCRCASPPARRASAPRPAPPARIRAA